ncbi:hypothetical protein [Rhodococcus sp. B50]|uniref:hypothetical protein n=1 Tax=Rhodococcus sp. B50 TaxID=2682847 RepID=UPI001BD64383|nr:hypothetical protein [Rhodococcus sp. B50]MBS9375498.1 hypothetical protein [Rhodococcus sp. B50]
MNVHPIEALTQPTASDPVPDLLERTLGLYYVSPSFWVAELCKYVLDLDPYAWAAEHYAGDWAAVLQASDGVARLADFHRAYSTAAGDVRSSIASWTGPSGDAAGHHLDTLADALREQAWSVHEIGKQLEGVALGMYEAGQAFAEILSAITDAALIAAIKWAAVTVSSATGVGLAGSVIVGGTSVAELKKILDLWSEAMTIHTTTWTAVQGLMGLLTGHLSTIENVEIPRLPSP